MMLFKIAWFSLMVLLLAACGTSTEESSKEVVKKVDPMESFAKKVKDYRPENFVINPGGVVKLKLPVLKGFENFTLKCKGNTIPHYIEGKKAISYISESYFSRLAPFSCTYDFSQNRYVDKVVIANFRVEQKEYPKEYLRVDKKRVFLSKKDLSRVLKEQKVLNRVYGNFVKRPLFSTGFIMPLNSKITSYYGIRRIYNNKKKGQHLGTDFRARVGVPIHSTNAGKVVLSRNLFYTGMTVILDHGMGIFTVYGHLSKLLVDEGEYVPMNTLLGLSGRSGRVTGPHLHWGVKIHGNWVDGQVLVKETQN